MGGKAGEIDLQPMKVRNKLKLMLVGMGDFCRLHGNFMAGNRDHAGIVLAPQQQYSIGQQLRGLLKLAASRSAVEMENQLVFSWCSDQRPHRGKLEVIILSDRAEIVNGRGQA